MKNPSGHFTMGRQGSFGAGSVSKYITTVPINTAPTTNTSANLKVSLPPEDRAKTVSDILQMFEGIWHDTGWGPRMESIFRATLHTLIENHTM